MLLATAGPFKGVKTVVDSPYQDASTYLSSGRNGYIRDVEGLSSWLVRPGFTLTNPNTQMGSGQRMQGAHSHIDPATGTIYRFFVVNGVVYRSDAAMAVFTVVTPGGVAIDTASTTRVSFLSVGASLVVSDGVNRPWVMSAFAATPVTGTYIDIDGAGGAWTAFGPPTIYQDSVMFITATVPGGSAIQARVGIVWSEPNQPAVGYTQSGYADFWNFIETGADPLYAILGTNSGLFLWRENSITVAAGTPSVNFSSTATRDARGDGVGTIAPYTVALYQSNIFFLDAQMRPWMMPVDSEPQPIWKQSILGATGRTPASITAYTTAEIVPELNQYAVAYRPLTAIDPNSPVLASVFDAATGAYGGEWDYGSEVGINILVQMRDANGLPCLIIGGGTTVTLGVSNCGFVWRLRPLADAVWLDTGSFTNNQIVTKPLGYSADLMMNPDRAVVITTTGDTITLFLDATYGAGDVTGTPTAGYIQANTTYSQEYRTVFGLDGRVARTFVARISPPTSTRTALQWGVQRIEVYGSRCHAGPEDA